VRLVLDDSLRLFPGVTGGVVIVGGVVIAGGVVGG
jgi:hypothetical protein